MTIQAFPNIEQLRVTYKDDFSNHAVRAASRWTEPNTSEPTDELSYLQRGLDIGDGLLDAMECALDAHIGR